MPTIKTSLRDERGVAMVLELVLVAVVLGLIGLAVYQTSRHSTPAASNTTVTTPAPNSPAGLARSAAAITEADSASDTAASTATDNISAQIIAADADVTNLGGASNANSF